jgi:hypothetical protein
MKAKKGKVNKPDRRSSWDRPDGLGNPNAFRNFVNRLEVLRIIREAKRIQHIKRVRGEPPTPQP